MRVKDFSCIALLCLIFCGSNLSAQNPAWVQDLEFEYLTRTTLYAGLDGNPKLRMRLTNVGTGALNDIQFDFRPDGEPQNLPGCATFPNGGFVNLDPGESTVVSVWSQCYFGDGLTLPQGSSEHSAEFKFQKDGESYHIVQDFTIVNDRERTSPALEDGSNITIAGTITVAGGYSPQVELFAKTVASQEFTIQTDQSAQNEYSFEFQAADREDWYLVVKAGPGDDPDLNFPNKTVKVGNYRDKDEIDISWAPIDYKYNVQFDLEQAIVTPTGFWKGAVSESEETVVFIPGQENWSGSTDQEKNVYREQSTLYKYNFSGEKLWEYQPGYECWGGDMSPDGSRVVYQLVPNGGTYGIGVLDGTTGQLLWKKEYTQLGPEARALEGLEAVLSNDASIVAVGTVPTGVVSFFDTETGNLIRQFPNAPDGTENWGQIRYLAFDAADEFIYVGSGDNYLRKVRVSDGQLIWRAFIGGWPFVNGFQFSSDESFIVTGTKSFDQARVNTDTGETVWINDTGSLEAALSSNDEYAINFWGDVMDAETGEYLSFLRRGAESHFIANDELIIKMDRNVQPFYLNGKPLNGSVASGGGQGSGEQSQWSYVSQDGAVAIIAYRDMVTDPGNQVGIAFYSGTVERVTLDPNDDPTDIQLSANAIDENNDQGETVGTLSASDPDANESHTFELVEASADNDLFTIEGNELKAASRLNYEERGTYEVLVKTVDANGAFLEKTLTINVNDVNDQPTEVQIDASEIAENLDEGTLIGKLNAVDEDQGDSHVFELLEGEADNNSFVLESGELKTASLFNFEAKSEYSVLVRATDAAGTSVDQELIISVTDANDAPTDITLSNQSVEQDLILGSVIAEFSTTDEDIEDNYTYELVSGEGSDDNTSFTVDGNRLLSNTNFDFNTQSEYNIRVSSTDELGATVSKSFVITVEIVAGLESTSGLFSKLYPNPTKGLVTIEMAVASLPLSYTIYDTSGNQLQSVKSVFTHTFQLDLFQKQRGIYFISLTDASGKATRKKILVID